MIDRETAVNAARRSGRGIVDGAKYLKGATTAMKVVTVLFSVAVLSFTVSIYLMFGLPYFLLTFGITVGVLTGWLVILYALIASGVINLFTDSE